MKNFDPSRTLDDDVAGCAAAHQRLLACLDAALDAGDVDPGRPSRLPGWTVGHLLTHLARNADAFRGMIDGAAVGETRLMYPSADDRDARINEGAARNLADLVTDVRKSVWALESSWAQLDADGWNGAGLTRLGSTPVASFPWRRWHEVEVHHADLGLAFTEKDWSAAFVANDLARQLAEYASDGNAVPAEVTAAAPWQQLAWLIGRHSGLQVPPPAWG